MDRVKRSSLFIVVFVLFISSFSFCGELFVNQAGYLPSLPKFFYYNDEADSFYIIEAGTGMIYYRGALEFFTLSDAATGMVVFKGDFSSFTREGIYYAKTNTDDISYEFSISSTVFDDVLRKSQKAFYFQRCGTPLFSSFAGLYFRSSCHGTDAVFHSSTGETGAHQSTRGWHDAGDYGKYVVNAGISAGTLLMAYEQYPEKFAFDNLNILESGNSIPDLLDEVKYETDWLLTMQAPGGGVYFKITPEQFEPFVMPAQATSTRYIYEISSTATGNFIAVLSRFARLYKSYDTSYSNKCLSAALNAWNYLYEHPDIIPAGGFHNPPGTATGQYGDGNDSDERLWAAAELFETTGEDIYKEYFEANYTYGGVVSSTMNWGNVRTLAQLTYLNSKQPTADNSVKTNISNALNSYCTQLLNRNYANAFGVTLNPGEYNWGCNSAVLNNAIILIYGYEETGNIDFRNAALDQLNYILGINGTSYCFVTGIGKKRVMHPHHRPSQADAVNEPVPGMLAGGPNQYLQDYILQQNFTSSTPPALCYIDHLDSYASNEIAINWNAPLVFVSGYFTASGPVPVKDETGLNIPGEFKLYQNYPNPFNPAAIINYSVARQSSISIIVYDALGREVSTLINMEQPAGEYAVAFNGAELSSGLYLCMMKAEEFSAVKKMLLIK